MSADDKARMIENMRMFGGSFVKNLAECFATADADNTKRLLAAFPEYAEKYKQPSYAVALAQKD